MPIAPSLQDLAHLASIEGIQAKVGQITRDMTLATGSVSYTGVGFRPDFLLFFGCTNPAKVAGAWSSKSQGLGDGWNIDAGVKQMAGAALYIYDSAYNYQHLTSVVFDDDGFTGTWTKGGTPTSTIAAQYLALKRSGLKSADIAFSRVMTVADGDVAYTGFGFKPTALLVLAGINQDRSASWGVSDGVHRWCIADGYGYTIGNRYCVGNQVIQIYDSATTIQYADHKSFDDDGSTLAYVKSGSPTKTINGLFIALR